MSVHLLRQLRGEIDAGLAMAEDPDNAGLPALALRTTTLHSPWFARNCRECRHKFREGDLVRLCPGCDEALHDDPHYGLDCWHRRFAGGRSCSPGDAGGFGRDRRECTFTWSGELPDGQDPADPAAVPEGPPPEALVYQFVHGLESVWRPFGERSVEKVQPGSPLVGLSCPWCRFDVRAGDWVTACPCGCGTYFHQDVFRHLTCWNGWNGVKGRNYCSTTGRPYPGADAPG